jgi:hypothetical protein
MHRFRALITSLVLHQGKITRGLGHRLTFMTVRCGPLLGAELRVFIKRLPILKERDHETNEAFSVDVSSSDGVYWRDGIGMGAR